MMIISHALVGGAIGSSTDNLAYIIILAIVSHFILDAIPHFDQGTWHDNKDIEKLETKDYILLAIDGVILLIFTYILWDNIASNVNIAVGAFFAVLVDLIDNVPFWKKFVRKLPVFKQIHEFHEIVHFRLKMKYWYLGVITQVLVIILALWVINK